MYDKSDCGQHLRKYVSCSLAWWHNYKWAQHRLCTVFGNDFIAHFFHSMFPDSPFLSDKMSHPALSTLLSIMRLAYPQFRQNLVDAIANDDQQLSIRSRNLLQNLFDMFEVYLPIVSSSTIILFVSCLRHMFISPLSCLRRSKIITSN
jgi:hypothetical protein